MTGLLYTGTGEREEDYIDVITPGKYYWRGDRHFLLYEERMEDVGAPVRNRLTIAPGMVKMQRNGLVKTDMVFIPKEETFTWYTTPYGQMEMKIYTSRITVEEEEDRIRAEVRYKLDMGSGDMDCFVRILIQPQVDPGKERV